MKNKDNLTVKIITICTLVLIILSTILGIIYLYILNDEKNYINEQNSIYKNSVELFNNLFVDIEHEIPNSNITLNQLEKVKNELDKISLDKEDYVKNKEDMIYKLEELKEYILVKEELYSYFDDDILSKDIDKYTIDSITSKYNNLKSNYKSLLEDKINLMNEEYNNISKLKELVTSLFTSEDRVKVSKNATRKKYNEALKLLELIKQEEIKIEEKKYLDIVLKELERREEEEALEKERQKEIDNAWKILDVPYISQNQNNVLNGCEVASLLMALQYKGYLRDMDLWTYAENLPKSDDPNTGFTHSIFEREPLDVPHWIAPEPLTKYGIETSGAEVINITGSSIDDIDKEILNGNPVVIYLTSKMNDPKEFVEGAPINLHVLLLTGYNTITNEHLIIDPWTQLDGRTKWYVDKSRVESIFNSTGKRAVVIR